MIVKYYTGRKTNNTSITGSSIVVKVHLLKQPHHQYNINMIMYHAGTSISNFRSLAHRSALLHSIPGSHVLSGRARPVACASASNPKCVRSGVRHL